MREGGRTEGARAQNVARSVRGLLYLYCLYKIPGNMGIVASYFRTTAKAGVASVSRKGKGSRRGKSGSRRGRSVRAVDREGDVSGSDTDDEHVELGGDLKTILLVQKHLLSSVLVHRAFAKEGFEVDIARSLTSAINLVTAKHYDTVIVDVSQFEMINYMSEAKDLIAACNKNQTYTTAPFILALVDESDSSSKHEIQRVGFQAFVSKPFRYGRLRQKEMRQRRKKSAT